MTRKYEPVIIGNKYGKLTVIEASGKDRNGEIKWRCSCDCGGENIVRGSYLKRGDIKSCGCLRREIKIGEIGGRLTVIDLIDKKSPNVTVSRIVCKCSCGRIVEVWSTNFRSGRTRSCGCLNLESLKKGHRKIDKYSIDELEEILEYMEAYGRRETCLHYDFCEDVLRQIIKKMKEHDV